MNCEMVAENMPRIVAGKLPSALLANCEQHIRQCPGCQGALRGTESLTLLTDRDTGVAPAGLFDRIVDEFVKPHTRPQRQGFWLGTGVGGAIAASLVALALTFGSFGPIADQNPAVAEFTVALSEPRNMDIAIEIDRALADANISILLSGGVELDGYGARRELSWTVDLEAGVNRLSLPILAVDSTGGQMVVRLDHPDSEQMFVVQLKTGA
jgi:hypothetical protein